MSKKEKQIQEYIDKWGPELEIGVDMVDEEHKLFFEMIEQVFEAANEGYKEFNAVFQLVLNHLAWHFKNEEEFMKSVAIHTKYIDYHNAIHSQCISQLVKMRDAVVKQNSSDDMVYQKELALNLAFFVKNWLVFHILGEDYKIAKQIEYIEDGNSPQRAYEMINEQMDKKIEILTITLSNLLKIYEIRNEKLLEIEADIKTSLKKKEEQLQEQIQENKKKSITDELTGLHNRRQAMFVLNNIWSEFQDPTCAIIQLDLDKFKEVNDTYGHHAGDLVLKQFSNAVKYFFETNELCNKYRYSDRETIHFCRLGGDEFLVILQKYSLDEAVAIANALHATVNNIEVFDEHKKIIWKGSTSIGVACRNADNRDFESVLKAADAYLYKAKEDGRNCVRSMLHEIGGGISSRVYVGYQS